MHRSATSTHAPLVPDCDVLKCDFLAAIRAWEIERASKWVPKRGRLLEVGAGTGQQAAELEQRGLEVEGIELAASLYADKRVFPITDYDGVTIPFPDAVFDMVYSSNVLEHVPDLARMHAEIKRVLKPGGHVVHILPTHCWRIWTSAAEIPVAFKAVRRCTTLREISRQLLVPLRQRRHGERGNVISEIWYFHPRWWRREFAAHGFRIVSESPMGLFYTGHQIMGARLGLVARARLSALLGSACHLYVLSVGTPEQKSAASQEIRAP